MSEKKDQKKEEEKKVEIKKKVPYRLLGNTGLRVFPITLGTMGFGQQWIKQVWKVGSSDEEINKIYKKYLDVGGNFLDTANFYQGGNSEKYIANLNKKLNVNRDDLIIATKYSLPMSTNVNHVGNSKKNLKRSLEGSLKRLNTSYIDILYVHYWDFTTGTKDLMRSLNEVVKSGKVTHIGISDCPAWEVAYANTLADQFGWEPFCIYQGKYGLLDRSLENDVFPMAKKFNVGVTPWGILSSGKLSGKRTRETEKNKTKVEGTQRQTTPITEEEFKIIDEVIKIGKEIKKTPAQVATNWVLNKPGIPSILVGPRTCQQLDDCLETLDFKLNDDQLKRLDDVSKGTKGNIFPHTMIKHNYKDQAIPYLVNKYYYVE